MNRRNTRRNRHIAGKIIASIACALLLLTLMFFLYVSDYYKAGAYAISCLESNDVSVSQMDDFIVFEPLETKIVAGLIFYPGGKVENTAYSPLMYELSKRGVKCYLLKMPFNLAVFDIDAADGIRNSDTEIEKWYIAGHSLGGACASIYAKDNYEKYDGLILLGAYSNKDLSDSNLNVLAMYGSNDQVINRDNYDKYRINLPADYKEVVINGGCHAFFGDYGFQKNDGTPVIDVKEQISETAECIESLICN